MLEHVMAGIVREIVHMAGHPRGWEHIFEFFWNRKILGLVQGLKLGHMCCRRVLYPLHHAPWELFFNITLFQCDCSWSIQEHWNLSLEVVLVAVRRFFAGAGSLRKREAAAAARGKSRPVSQRRLRLGSIPNEPEKSRLDSDLARSRFSSSPNE